MNATCHRQWAWATYGRASHWYRGSVWCGFPGMVSLWPLSVTMGLLSTVKISRLSVTNGIFTTLHQAPYHAQSNGRVENAVKTCKSLLTKAWADKRDPLLELLEWRNTPTEGMNASPVQLLYDRRTHTRLPVAKQLLTPQVISDVPEKIKIRKQKQKHYCDRHSHKLPKLLDGDAIRMQLPCKKEWSMGRVIGEEGARSYLVERKALPSETQMAQGNTRGVTGVSGDKPRHDRSYWTGWVKPSWAATANNTIITSGFWAAHWRSSSTGPPPPVWLKDYECGKKTLTLPCASFLFTLALLCIAVQRCLMYEIF